MCAWKWPGWRWRRLGRNLTYVRAPSIPRAKIGGGRKNGLDSSSRPLLTLAGETSGGQKVGQVGGADMVP